MLKATRWAGNVGELAQRRSPISSPLFPAFTPLPYYRVYRSTFTPLGPPTPGARSRHRDGGLGRGRKTNMKKQVSPTHTRQSREPGKADPGF